METVNEDRSRLVTWWWNLGGKKSGVPTPEDKPIHQDFQD